jgi:hypothetical protein
MKKLLLPVALTAVGLVMAPSAQAQSPSGRPLSVPSVAAQSINPNPYIAPGLTLGQYAYNTSVMGRALSKVPPYALGYNPYPTTINYGPVYRTYNPYLVSNPYLTVPPSAYYANYPSVSPYP